MRKATHVRITKGKDGDGCEWELYKLGDRIHSGSRGHEYRCLDGEGRVVRVCAAMGDRDADHGDSLYTSGENVRFVRLSPARLFVCGTRAVVMVPSTSARESAAFNYRVVCATCGAGGTVHHSSSALASSAAIRDSARPCHCGAS